MPSNRSNPTEHLCQEKQILAKDNYVKSFNTFHVSAYYFILILSTTAIKISLSAIN